MAVPEAKVYIFILNQGNFIKIYQPKSKSTKNSLKITVKKPSKVIPYMRRETIRPSGFFQAIRVPTKMIKKRRMS